MLGGVAPVRHRLDFLGPRAAQLFGSEARGMVGVAQLVELRLVVPVVAGSSPVAHPPASGPRHCRGPDGFPAWTTHSSRYKPGECAESSATHSRHQLLTGSLGHHRRSRCPGESAPSPASPTASEVSSVRIRQRRHRHLRMRRCDSRRRWHRAPVRPPGGGGHPDRRHPWRWPPPMTRSAGGTTGHPTPCCR